MSSKNKLRPTVQEGGLIVHAQNGPEPGLLSLNELLGLASDSTSTPDGSIDDDRQKVSEQSIRERETERLGTEKYYELRDKWSKYIHRYVWAMIGFQFLVTAAIGFGWVGFKGYQFLITLVLGQNFAQIVGMGVIVAKFLFSDPKRAQKSKA